MEENLKITIQGKTIDYSNFSDEKLIKLYNELIERQELLYNKIMQANEKYHFIEEN